MAVRLAVVAYSFFAEDPLVGSLAVRTVGALREAVEQVVGARAFWVVRVVLVALLALTLEGVGVLVQEVQV